MHSITYLIFILSLVGQFCTLVYIVKTGNLSLVSFEVIQSSLKTHPLWVVHVPVCTCMYLTYSATFEANNEDNNKLQFFKAKLIHSKELLLASSPNIESRSLLMCTNWTTQVLYIVLSIYLYWFNLWMSDFPSFFLITVV